MVELRVYRRRYASLLNNYTVLIKFKDQQSKDVKTVL